MNWLLKGEPYEVQAEAIRKAAGRRGFGFFMEMGLGKTATAYAEFANLLESDLVDTMVVVCPQSLKQVWVDEAEEWELGYGVETWPKPREDVPWHVLAINYEALIGAGGRYLDNFMGNPLRDNRVYLVMDESIHVKNPRAKRTKRMIALAAKAEYVRVLSGAPIVQSPLDLWGQMRCIGELKGVNPYAFRNRFCSMGGYMGKQIVGARNEEELTGIIEDHSFRAKKSNWTNLPEMLFNIRNYNLTGEQSRQYLEMKDQLVLNVKDEVITAPMVITQMMKLQQISSGFVIDEQGSTIELVEEKNNPKLKLTSEIVEELDSKVIIFAFYKNSIKMLTELFDCACITGNQSPDVQTSEKRSFNEGTKKVMVAQLTAGKYGHTLLGTKEMPCHTSIFFENNYDLDARIQAEARNHRHGQHYPVTYVDLVGTQLDKKIVSALQKKQKMASAIVDAVRSVGIK